MKVRRYDPRISKRLVALPAVCLFIVAVRPAHADVPAYPPQNVPALQTLAQTPNSVPINYQGGRINVNIDDIRNGKPLTFNRVSGGSNGLTGYRTNPVNLYDNYGNVARGQIQTQTALPPKAIPLL